MIRSMTGFGEATREVGNDLFHVEIRSVNHRYFKASLRLPEDLGFLETDLERLIRQRLSRGSITFRLHIRSLSSGAAYPLNIAAVQHYAEQLAAIRVEGTPTAIDLATLATLPGVVQPPEMDDAQREQRAHQAVEVTELALAQLLEMRSTEGRGLAEDLKKHCAALDTALAQIQARVPQVTAEYRDRLQARVTQLLADQPVELAADDLRREVAIYADRSDISEEVQRLTAHVRQFESALDKPDSAGRKMDFIAQEMLREANTIGSKSNDQALAESVIELKSNIDRIKEQVQNVE